MYGTNEQSDIISFICYVLDTQLQSAAFPRFGNVTRKDHNIIIIVWPFRYLMLYYHRNYFHLSEANCCEQGVIHMGGYSYIVCTQSVSTQVYPLNW